MEFHYDLGNVERLAVVRTSVVCRIMWRVCSYKHFIQDVPVFEECWNLSCELVL